MLIHPEDLLRYDLTIRDVIERFFAGSPKALLTHLLATEQLDDAEIRAIRREVNAKLREHSGKEGGP